MRCSPHCATWSPGPPAIDIAIRIGPWIEAVALQHPGGSYTPYGERYRKLGRLRCETDKILGVRNPSLVPLTHAAAGLDLPADIGMPAAHYGVHVEARRPDNTGHTLLRIGPYNQTWLASRDADRLNSELAGRAATAIPGFTVVAKGAPFDVSDHESYDDPYERDAAVLLAAAIAREVSA
ncbi:hypothetical protein OG562_38330 [Streptomyces sp. NBC_01275]|uniref:hypothetical protein n=1 Tax=Streptomyces sp. NBC_01275 TaxID=2903807 RepID=UPI00225AB80D|nr:hypothetical protein [Streptomyces sp. NBC_01275]MCX4766732.1 hypothetical protein [Streptomyces sp. NBC_01275]